ncbi:MAG: aspartyl protease family protein, partial [Planctomycetota bacterium JB042]
VGERRVLLPLSAVEGTVRGTIDGTPAGAFEVVGIVAFERAFDLALVEVDATLPEPELPIRGDRLGAPTAALLLGVARDTGWSATPVSLAPGAIDRFGGGPRLAIEPPAAFGGVAIDVDGAVVGLVPAAGDDARAVALAADWPARGDAPIPLDRFLRNAGPGGPASRVATARKLLGQRRFDEAARLLLELTAAEPRLIDEVGDDLRHAALEAARAHVTAGDGPTAVVLLTDVLARRPEDAEVWAARGRAHAVAGEVPAAVDAFVRAIALDPSREEAWRDEARSALLDEVNRLHGRGLVDVALRLLLDHRADFPGDGRLRTTAADLLLEDRRFAAAADLYDEAAVLDARVAAEAREGARRARDLAGGPGAIVIDFVPGAADVAVDARIDDRVTTRLRLDPSLDLSVITPAVARGAKYSLAGAPRIRWDLDPAVEEVHVVELRSVVVGGVGTDRVRAAVAEGAGGAAAEGVLGASFLGRYRRVEDRSLGRIVLWPR